jgi:hypothetical protein
MDSVLVVPRRFTEPPYLAACLVFGCQLVLWPLATLQLMRGYAWFTAMNPLLWLILLCIYMGVCMVTALTVVLVIAFKGRRLERHIHPNLASMVYLVVSLITSGPAFAVLCYYYVHYGGEPPYAKHAGDIQPAIERRDIWLSGQLLLTVACLLGVYQFLTNILSPSIVALRYTITTGLTSPPTKQS